MLLLSHATLAPTLTLVLIPKQILIVAVHQSLQFCCTTEILPLLRIFYSQLPHIHCLHANVCYKSIWGMTVEQTCIRESPQGGCLATKVFLSGLEWW